MDHRAVLQRSHLHLILVELLQLMLAQLRHRLHWILQRHRISHHLRRHRVHHVRTDHLKVPRQLFCYSRPLVAEVICCRRDFRQVSLLVHLGRYYVRHCRHGLLVIRLQLGEIWKIRIRSSLILCNARNSREISLLRYLAHRRRRASEVLRLRNTWRAFWHCALNLIWMRFSFSLRRAERLF